MSDKLSDEQWSKLAEFDLLIDEYQGALLNGNHAERAVGRGQLKQVFREALLSASPAPAIHMPPLNDAMRAVLTNENCIYGTPDELYAALVMAAPAISESEDAEPLAWYVEWQRDGETWVDAFAVESQAIDRAKYHNGTVTPCYPAARKGEKS